MVTFYIPPDKCFNLKSRTIREEIVPLPDAGAPKMIVLITGERIAAIFHGNVWRECSRIDYWKYYQVPTGNF